MYGCYKFFDIFEDSLLEYRVTVNRIIGFQWSFERWRFISNEIVNIWSDPPVLGLPPFKLPISIHLPPPALLAFCGNVYHPICKWGRGGAHYVHILLWYNFRLFQFHASLFDVNLSSFFKKISIVSKIDEQIQILQSGFNSIIQVCIS